ncbi:MAG: protease, partial [Rhodothermales bacterium]|nr:protease [Rhodothermales bacterium]
MDTREEHHISNERTTDIHPIWMGETVYFLSDRDWAMNVWAYDPGSDAVRQVTMFDDAEAKWLNGHAGTLVVEQDGWIHTVNPETGELSRIEITVSGDFPWAEAGWEDVSSRARSASLSPTGKRAVFEARGEIFTVPAENGDVRNLTRSSTAADRSPVWSPDGASIAWFSDASGAYQLMIADQSGMDKPRALNIGESVLAWEPTWSPDGAHIAFVDDDVRIKVINVETGDIRTADVAGANYERGNMGISWSPDSKWLAYSKTFSNNLHRIVVWSSESGEATALTDEMADAVRPAWDRDGRHLYFLASTNLAQDAGWANTSTIKPSPTYGAYVLVLRADDPTPFVPESDEEPAEEPEEDTDEAEEEEESDDGVVIDFPNLERRIVALPMPVRNYGSVLAGPKGSVFIGERIAGQPALTLHKFSLEDREKKEFMTGVSPVSVSADGSKMLVRAGSSWRVVGTASPPSGSDGRLDVSLIMRVDRGQEWTQIFEEAWRYERDYFYDPGMHGNDWQAVHDRYAPLVPHVRHRADLTYILDQINGELSVGHSFVRGGDYPSVESEPVGVLGADLVVDRGAWRIDRILTYESWNPTLEAPLARAGLDVGEGDYLVGIDGMELTAADDPYRLLDGTVDRQIVLMVNQQPGMEGARAITVEPIGSENALRQRAWVEDNRRKVDELSGGRLAYVWVPNTGGPGVVSFDRYYFAQQDKEGAVID